VRFKNTWILLIVAVILLGFFFLFEEPGHKQKLEREESEQALTNLSRSQIARLTIETPGRRTIDLEKQDGTWMIRSPVADVADEATVNTLLSSIAAAEIERTLEPDSSRRDEFGLNGTATRVTCATAGGDTTLSLTIGAHTLTKSHFYARRDDSPAVLLLPATIRRYAVKDLADFRDKKVMDFMLEDVTAFRIASSSRTLRWDRLPGNGWIMVQKQDTIRGDTDEIESILRQLRGLRVRSFVSDDPADFAQYWKDPKNAVTVWTAGDTVPRTLQCGILQEGEFCAKIEGGSRIVKLDGIFLDIFNKTVRDLRDRHLLSFDQDAVFKISIETPDTSGTIVRTGTEWSFLNPSLGAIEQQRVSSFVALLKDLKCDSVVEEKLADAAGRGFSRPFFSLTLFDEGGRLIDRLVAGGEDPRRSGRFVTSRSTGFLALVDPERLGAVLDRFRHVAQR
jgi:hypothetical protein